MMMKIFVNTTAKVESLVEIEKLAETGMLDGVTTNPTSCNDSSEFNNLSQFIGDIPPYFNGHVIVECTATNYEAILERGERLVDRNKNVIVTVPLTQDGLRAYRTSCKCRTSENKIQVNIASSCCSITQALLAAKTGATYISIPAEQPHPGDELSISDDRISLIEDICDIYKKYESIKTKILLTSINNLEQVEQAARIGVHAVVIPSSIFWQIIPK